MKPMSRVRHASFYLRYLAAAALGLGVAGPARAEEGEVCKRARLMLDEPLTDATEEVCQQALDTAEEDKWQLWLDVAQALETTKDVERSTQMLERFVMAADKRGPRIAERWAVLRDEARAKIAKVEGELLKTMGRVTITTVPDGAEVTVLGSAKPGAADKTPVTRFLPPGTHIARVVSGGNVREVSFPIAVGQRVEVKVDLRADGPSTVSVDGVVLERDGAVASVVAQPVDGGGVGGTVDGPGLGGPGEATTPAERAVPSPSDDDADEALRTGGVGMWTRLGTAGISIGAAAIAAGLVFTLQGVGLDDEAACAGDACEVDAPLRALVRADADTSWTRATGAFIVGGALVAGGIVAVLLDPGPAQATVTPRTQVTPWIGPEGAGVVGQLRF